jgi:hypothetical protein
MSLGALTTLAAVRDKRAPLKQDVGKAASDKAGEPASLTDILVSQVPTELVAPYTAIAAAIVGAVAKPTRAVPNPDQLATWCWLAFAILIMATVVLIWEGKRRKSPDTRFPLLEEAGGVAAATGWAFALPGSPLIPYLHGTSQILAPLIVAFAAVAVTAMTASACKHRGVLREPNQNLAVHDSPVRQALRENHLRRERLLSCLQAPSPADSGNPAMTGQTWLAALQPGHLTGHRGRAPRWPRMSNAHLGRVP